MRAAVVAGLVVVAGCGPAAVRPDAPPLDFTGWPALTPQPVTLDGGLFAFCIELPEQKRLGPHFVPRVRYLVNPAGEAAVRDGRLPVPVGTTVVKVKAWPEEFGHSEWFAAMVKREAGYDPDNGDWEYLTARQETGRWTTERGRLTECASCHRQAARTDFLFRGYLKP